MGRRLTWSSLGKAAMLFWNGYATHLPFIQTYDTRSNTFHALSPDPAETLQRCKQVQQLCRRLHSSAIQQGVILKNSIRHLLQRLAKSKARLQLTNSSINELIEVLVV